MIDEAAHGAAQLAELVRDLPIDLTAQPIHPGVERLEVGSLLGLERQLH